MGLMDVSVVIVSFNAASYLKECLDSIINFTRNTSFEIIVVDNNSTDDSVAVAKSFGKKIALIANQDNRGFAAGVNAGLKKAVGKYVLVLNPDIRFLDDAISAMMAFMDDHKDVGLAGCVLLDSEQKLLSNGGYFPTLTRLFFWAFFLDDLPYLGNLIKSYHPSASPLLKRETLFSGEFYPDWVTGGFMFVRQEVVKKVGLMDEGFFMYGEEVDWQYRIVQAGHPSPDGCGMVNWRIAYTPMTKVIHHERKSWGGSPRGSVLGEFRGLKYIYGKHFPGWKQIVLGMLLDIAAFNRILLWLARRRLDMVKLYAEALIL